MAKSKKSWVNLKNRKFKTDLEKFVNKAIPYVLIFLAVLIILENPFWTLVHLEDYEPYVTILDFIIIGFFVVELYFKWIRTKNLKKFVKLGLLKEEKAGNVVLYFLNLASLKARTYTGFVAEYVAWNKKHIPYKDIEKISKEQLNIIKKP